MNQFTINIDNKVYTVIPLQEEDQMLFEVHDNKLLCIIGLNEYGEWEANCDFDENIVSKIGEGIEYKEG